MEIWGAIVTSGGTLIGVLLGGLITWYVTKTTIMEQRTQFFSYLNHERDEADKSRKIEIKKTIYLEAIEKMTGASYVMIQFLDPNISDAEINRQMEEVLCSINKTFLVGEEGAMQQIQETMSLFKKSVLGVLDGRQKIVRQNEEIKSNMRVIKSLTQELMTFKKIVVHLSSGYNPEQIGFCLERVSDICSTLNLKLNETEKMKKRKNVDQLSLAKECAANIGTVMDIFVDVVKVWRAEIGIPLSEEVFREIKAEAEKKRKEYISTIFEKMDREDHAETLPLPNGHA